MEGESGGTQEETRGRAPHGPALPAASAAKQNQPHLDFKYAPPDVKTLLSFTDSVFTVFLMSLYRETTSQAVS